MKFSRGKNTASSSQSRSASRTSLTLSRSLRAVTLGLTTAVIAIVSMQTEAQAKEFCVNRSGCTPDKTFNGLTGSPVTPATALKNAINAANNDLTPELDRILIGPGIYSGNFLVTDDHGPIAIEGVYEKGSATVIKPTTANSPALHLFTAPTGSSVTKLKVELTAEGQTGVELTGATATDINIVSDIDTDCANMSSPTTGIVIDEDSRADQISVVGEDCPGTESSAVKLLWGELVNSVIQGGDRSIVASPWADGSQSVKANIKGVEVQASSSVGVYLTDSPNGLPGGKVNLSDTLIKQTSSGQFASQAVKLMTAGTFTANLYRVTVARPQGSVPLATGVSVDSTTGAGNITVNLTDSVVYQLGKTLECKDTNAAVKILRSYYTATSNCPAPNTLQETDKVAVQSPGFIDAAAGNFRLKWGSELIDKGTDLSGAGFMIPPVDPDGVFRTVDGDGDGIKRYDLGAYEYGKRAPIINKALAVKSQLQVNESTSFQSTAKDLDQGDTLQYFWDFGDGSKDQGPYVNKAFYQPNTYNVTLTVKDQSGLTTSSSFPVTVLPPTTGIQTTTPTPPGNGKDPVTVVPTATNRAPISKIKRIAKNLLKASKLRTLTGTASDDRSVKAVKISITKRSGNRCFALQAGGTFKRYRRTGTACKTFFLLTAKGTAKWQYKLKKSLPKGTYVIQSQAIDNKGEKETKYVTNRNKLTFKLR